MIPYGRHWLDEDDIRAVTEVLRHGNLTQGPKVEAFEKSVAAYTGARYAVAVSSGTAALHLACLAAGVGKDDAVVTSPNTFVASANCALYVGAAPHFADIKSDTLNMDPEKLDAKCKALGRVKAVIPVHFAGLPCEMPAIQAVAARYGAAVIEDASHALGASYPDGGRVGNCSRSLMTVFSFHPVKMVTSGEGGMITTNDEKVYKSLLRLRSHGINKGDDAFVHADQALDAPGGAPNPWYYEMQSLGFNYRITDIQCALGVSQMTKLDRFVARRLEIASRYDAAFQNLPSLSPMQTEGRKFSSHHLYVARIAFDRLGISRRELMEELAKAGIGGQVHYIPVPLHPFYRKNFRIPETDYTQALVYYREALTLPLFAAMADRDAVQVIEAFESLLKCKT